MWLNKASISKAIISVFIFAFIILFGAVLGLPGAKSSDVSAQTVSVCLNREDIPVEDLHWVYVPDSADQLHTEERYFYLAGKLISNNVVDASDCPSGGLMLNGYANACGMDAAMDTEVTVQNLLNEPILQAWDDVSVPPVILKLLIATESQFWPTQETIYHYGYGHVTNIGIRNALQWNANLRAKVCPDSAGASCAYNYSIAEQILSSLIATCDTCEYGIDQTRADRSVDVLAEVLMGYCYQAEQLVFNATGWNANLAVDYVTIWKLTLMNYNVGSQCVYDTLEATFNYTNGPMNWSDISAYATSGCSRGITYANQITAEYFDFPPGE